MTRETPLIDRLMLPRSLPAMNLSGGLRKRQLQGRLGKELSSSESFVEKLDIEQELYGHTGCINALDWSANGRYLASGSDDRRVIIWDAFTQKYEKAKDIHTGHSRNIFSVKFVHGTGDRTLITAAGDREIRIFDVEYGSSSPSIMYEPCQRTVHRAHRDRVKRIVVEDDGHCFLSCSEDGDVRQFDLREHNSKAYRSPLISYAKYQIDLNTIALNQRNPYLLAVGGTHPCAFLHDRRMTGREMLNEWGKLPTTKTPTQCVRKFRSNRKIPTAYRREHMTALRFGTDNPRELLCSWLNDDIYLFDIHNSISHSKASTSEVNSRPHKNGAHSSQKRKRSISPACGPEGSNVLVFANNFDIWRVLHQTRKFLLTTPLNDFDGASAYQNYLSAVELAKWQTNEADFDAAEQHLQNCRMTLGALVNDATMIHLEWITDCIWQSSAIYWIVLGCCNSSLDPRDYEDATGLEEYQASEDSPVFAVSSLASEDKVMLFPSHTDLKGQLMLALSSRSTLIEMKSANSREFWIEKVCPALLLETEADVQEMATFFANDANRQSLYRGTMDDWDDSEDSSLEDESEGAEDESSSFEEQSDNDIPIGLRSQLGDLESEDSPDAFPQVSVDFPIRSYSGHVNVDTIKDVNFLGLREEYIMSGSDDGLLFIWEKSSGQIVKMLQGDDSVTNVMESNPSCTSLAVSGIDDTVKIFQAFEHDPDVKDRNSRRINVSEYEIRARNKARMSNADGMQDLVIPRGLMMQLARHQDDGPNCRQQ